MEKKPVIGVIPLYDEERDSVWMIPGYLQGILEAGGIPIIIPLYVSTEEIEQLNKMIDGYLLTGGHDVEPELYGRHRTSYCGVACKERDSLEQMLYEIAYRDNKAVLGICRGIQLINVLHGGTLYQDIPREYNQDIEHHMTPPYDRTVHNIKIEKSSPLYELLTEETLAVNSYHHQGIDELGKNLSIMAVAEDGLVEGVYVPNKKFIWGIQWHPELIYRKDTAQKSILRAFIEACL